MRFSTGNSWKETFSIGKNPYVERMSVRIEQRNLHLTLNILRV